jgi:hypothetical protein
MSKPAAVLVILIAAVLCGCANWSRMSTSDYAPTQPTGREEEPDDVAPQYRVLPVSQVEESDYTPRLGVYTSPPPNGHNPFMLLRLVTPVSEDNASLAADGHNPFKLLRLVHETDPPASTPNE